MKMEPLLQLKVRKFHDIKTKFVSDFIGYLVSGMVKCFHTYLAASSRDI